MIPGGESLSSLDPAQAALDAVKTYIRMNRERLIRDGELLALLQPERFGGNVRDMQRYAIDKLTAELQALRLEREALKLFRDRSARLNENVRRAVLDLVGMRAMSGTVALALQAGKSFGAEASGFCAEYADAFAGLGCMVHPLLPGTVRAVVGEGMGAILSGGGELLFGRGGERLASLAAFRLRLGCDAPDLLYVLGSEAKGRFEGREIEAGMRFFAQALERALCAEADGKWFATPIR